MPFGTGEGKAGFKRIPSLPRRSGQGKLLPMKVPILGEEQEQNEIVMIPFTIGRMNEISAEGYMGTKMNFEKILCEECLVLPKLTWKEYQCLLPGRRWKIYLTLAFECGFDIDQYLDPSKSRAKVPEADKSDKRRMFESLKNDLSYARECYSMHEMNYNFHTVQTLCRREISITIDVMKEANSKGGAKGKGGKSSKGKGRKGKKR